MSTQLYNKDHELLYPNTLAKSVSFGESNVQVAIDTLKGEISGLLDNVKDLIEDVEYLKEHGGSGTVVIPSSVQVNIHNFPSQLSGQVDLSEYGNYVTNVPKPYATFTYSNIDNPTKYTATVNVFGKTFTETKDIQANEDTEIYIDLPATTTPGNKTVKVTVTIEGVSGSASKSFTTKFPSLLIWHESDKSDNININNAKYKHLVLSELSGQYTAPGNEYLWIVTTDRLKKLTIGNISAPYEQSTVTNDNTTYNCYRTLIKPDQGTKLNIEIQ